MAGGLRFLVAVVDRFHFRPAVEECGDGRRIQMVSRHARDFVESQVDVGSTFSFTLPIKPGSELVSMQDGGHKNGKVK